MGKAGQGHGHPGDILLKNHNTISLLKRLGQEVVVRDTPAIRGMIRKVQHLVEVRVVAGEAELFGIRHRPNQPKASRPRKSE